MFVLFQQSTAVGVALKEALTAEYKEYQMQVVKNSKTLCAALQKRGYTVVSGWLWQPVSF